VQYVRVGVRQVGLPERKGKEMTPHRDLNPKRQFRKPPFYPVKLWKLDSGVVLDQAISAVSPTI
jgi:hypothetical protein